MIKAIRAMPAVFSGRGQDPSKAEQALGRELAEVSGKAVWITTGPPDLQPRWFTFGGGVSPWDRLGSWERVNRALVRAMSARFEFGQTPSPPAIHTFRRADIVEHTKFGIGRVVDVDHHRIHVVFEGDVRKVVVASFLRRAA